MDLNALKALLASIQDTPIVAVGDVIERADQLLGQWKQPPRQR